MGRIVFLLVAILALGACTSNPVPEGYGGPLAQVTDSMTPRSNKGADFFFLSAVNGKKVDNNLSATAQANYGRGFQMTPLSYGRDVPAVTATFGIAGRTHYAAPILELMNPVYEVAGEVSFTPVPNRAYVVRGVLGDDYSAVWIEERNTGQTVGQKIEKKGSARLGVFER
jgi:hypothetical protein